MRQRPRLHAPSVEAHRLARRVRKGATTQPLKCSCPLSRHKPSRVTASATLPFLAVPAGAGSQRPVGKPI